MIKKNTMEPVHILAVILVILAVVWYFGYFKDTAKPSEPFAQLGNPMRYAAAPPSLAALPVAPRSPPSGLLSKSLFGEGLMTGIAPPQPVMMPQTFASLGGGFGGAPDLQNKVLTSSQADNMLQNRMNGGEPYLPPVSLPLNNIEYDGGNMDATDAQNFMYDRTIFAPLKRRYGNQVDFFRGDVQIKQQNRGWFDISPATEKDIVVGYFDRYIDIQQEMAINDATFTRSLTPAQQTAAAQSPAGIQAVAYANI